MVQRGIMADSSKPSGEGPLILKKFNSTSNPTSTEVITQKFSAAERSRRAMLISMVVVALGIISFIAFRTSGLDPRDITNVEHGGGFNKKPDNIKPTD